MTPPSIRCLLRRSIDLRGLYRRAARNCEPGLRLVLEENVQVLDLLVTELLPQVECVPGGGVRGSWRGGMHRRVTDWLTRSAANRDLAWIRVLAFHESALLQAFESAIAALPSQQAMLLRRQLPRLHAIHLDMHHLAGNAPH
jgi:hypothetical protein